MVHLADARRDKLQTIQRTRSASAIPIARPRSDRSALARTDAGLSPDVRRSSLPVHFPKEKRHFGGQCLGGLMVFAGKGLVDFGKQLPKSYEHPAPPVANVRGKLLHL